MADESWGAVPPHPALGLEEQNKIKSTSPFTVPYSRIHQIPQEQITARATATKLTGLQIATSDFSPQEVVRLMHEGATVMLRQSALGLLPLIILIAVTLALALRLTLFFPVSILPISLGNGIVFSLPIFLILPAVVSVCFFQRLLDRTYHIADTYVMTSSGFCSKMLRHMPVSYAKISEIEIVQTIFQRLVNVGDLRFGVSNVASPEVVFKGIHNPGFYLAVCRLKLAQQRGNPEHVEGLTP